MFQQRQLAEIYPLVEISVTAAVSPGAVGNGTTVYTTAACTSGGSAAQFALGDQLEIWAPASAALNGINLTAVATATAGTVGLYFVNNTGGSITPVASSVYKIVAIRPAANIVV